MAVRLHAASIKLLRLLRREDENSELSARRMSALSAIAFAGPVSLAELAAAEQVRPPTMSRLVEALVGLGLITRETDPANRRMVSISATSAGHDLLEAGRGRRVRLLSDRLKRLADSEQRALYRAVELIERVAQS